MEKRLLTELFQPVEKSLIVIADQWFLFYNGHNEAKLAASGAKDVYDVHSKQLFMRYRGLIDECNSKLDNKRTK